MARLTTAEIETLLSLDVPAHLGTIDSRGFPRITPIWFTWESGTFYMTSVAGKPQLKDLERDQRASVEIDIEDRISVGGMRANRQVRARGLAALSVDKGGHWTKKITLKYIAGPEGQAKAKERAAVPRVVIELEPTELIGLKTEVPVKDSSD